MKFTLTNAILLLVLLFTIISYVHADEESRYLDDSEDAHGPKDEFFGLDDEVRTTYRLDMVPSDKEKQEKTKAVDISPEKPEQRGSRCPPSHPNYCARYNFCCAPTYSKCCSKGCCKWYVNFCSGGYCK